MSAKQVAVALAALAALALGTEVRAQTGTAVAAGCRLAIEPGSSRWTIESYDPFAGAAAYGQFQMAWTNQGDQPCEGEVVTELTAEAYGLRNPLSPSAGLLRYGLVDESNGVDRTPYTAARGARHNGPLLRVEPGQRVVQTFGLLVDVEDLGGDGVYQQTVKFGLRRPNSVVVEAQRDVTLAINVRPSAVMGLTGTFQRRNGAARIDLGELTTGRTNDPVNLWVRGTRGYKISVRSENHGRLVQPGGDWAVPYALSLGGTTIDLANPVPFQSTPGDGLRNDTYPLVITVGRTDGQRAGRYSDLLTLTLAPI